MHRIKPILTVCLLLCAATAWAAAPAVTAPATPAATTPAVPPTAALPNLTPQPTLTVTCPPQPVTTCTSCLYFGIQSAYQCTTYCVNGVFHRSCTTCGEGCNL